MTWSPTGTPRVYKTRSRDVDLGVLVGLQRKRRGVSETVKGRTDREPRSNAPSPVTGSCQDLEGRFLKDGPARTTECGH